MAVGRVGVLGRKGIAVVVGVLFNKFLRMVDLAVALQRTEYPLQQGIVEVDQPFIALRQDFL